MKLIGTTIKDESKLLEQIEEFRQSVITQIRPGDAEEQELCQKLKDTNDAEDVFRYACQLYEKRLREIEQWRTATKQEEK